MTPDKQAVFRFGDFVLNPSECLLLRGGMPGNLLTKDELLDAVWPGVVVEEVNLSVNVSALREVLDAAPAVGEWIETVPRQGYRINSAVEVSDGAAKQRRRSAAGSPSGMLDG